MTRTMTSFLIGALSALAPVLAHAHVGIEGFGFANTTQEVVLAVGHGCAGADTYRVKLTIPAGVISVRPMRSDFGKVSVEKDAAGTITAVVWQKADTDVLDGDLAYYKLVVRLRVPDAPFTSIFLPALQTCRAADGTLSMTDWKMLPTDPVDDGGAAEPAPELRILPPRRPGWNRFVVPVAVADLSKFFSDALIVWKGNAAYSANPNTAELIGTTPGVTALSSLALNDEIWVRY